MLVFRQRSSCLQEVVRVVTRCLEQEGSAEMECSSGTGRNSWSSTNTAPTLFEFTSVSVPRSVCPSGLRLKRIQTLLCWYINMYTNLSLCLALMEAEGSFQGSPHLQQQGLLLGAQHGNRWLRQGGSISPVKATRWSQQKGKADRETAWAQKLQYSGFNPCREVQTLTSKSFTKKGGNRNQLKRWGSEKK